MKTKTHSLLAVHRTLWIACILVVPLLSCGFFGIADYELSVILQDGVQGTPENGQHFYKDLTVVEYAYKPVNPLHTVEVIYANGRRSASGNFTMYTNVDLEARLIDIRANWKIKFVYADASIASIEFIITFSGSDVLSGTFSDDRGYAGTWNAGSGQIKITYLNWGNYVLESTSLFNMNGTWTGESKNGTWSATRQ